MNVMLIGLSPLFAAALARTLTADTGTGCDLRDAINASSGDPEAFALALQQFVAEHGSTIRCDRLERDEPLLTATEAGAAHAGECRRRTDAKPTDPEALRTETLQRRLSEDRPDAGEAKTINVTLPAMESALAELAAAKATMRDLCAKRNDALNYLARSDDQVESLRGRIADLEQQIVKAAHAAT